MPREVRSAGACGAGGGAARVRGNAGTAGSCLSPGVLRAAGRAFPGHRGFRRAPGRGGPTRSFRGVGGVSGCRGCGPPLAYPVQKNGRDAGEGVPGRGRRGRPPGAHVRKQRESGDQTAGRGPEGVGRVEPADPLPGLAPPDDGEAAEHRQGRPHQGRRRQQQGEGQGEPGRREPRVPGNPGQGRAGPLQPGDAGRNQQGRGGYPYLEQAVYPQRIPPSVGEASEPEAAEGEAGHEGGQHRAHRPGADPEHHDQHARPDQLVHEGAGPGNEEQYEEGCESSAGLPRARGADFRFGCQGVA